MGLPGPRSLVGINPIFTIPCDGGAWGKPMVETKSTQNIPIELTVVLGRMTMPIKQIVRMSRGSIINLNIGLKEHTWIYAGNRLIARGEIVVTNEKISVRITKWLDHPDAHFERGRLRA